MTDARALDAVRPTDWSSDAMRRRVRRRYGAERRFRLVGLGAILISASFLLILLGSMIARGAGGFVETRVAMPIDFSRAALDVDPTRLSGRGADLALAGAGLRNVVEAAALDAFGPDLGGRILSDGAWLRVRDAVKADPALLGRRAILSVPVASSIDVAAKGSGTPQAEAVVASLRSGDLLSTGLNLDFLGAADSTDPTRAGIWGALKGSLLTMLVTMSLAFPTGLLAALYLEEYAPKNRWTDLLEVSINNLAAVPSIIFGLLGLALFLGVMGLPRSAPLVGGLTLALLTMPVIVITARNAITAVPPSIREAAMAVGASPVQVVFHHVLPLAMPGIMTGAILGLARALGETAPLLLIGMRAFIAAPPRGLTEPATALPVQIFLWSDEVSRGFVEKTSAAIIVLLLLLLLLNGVAIYLRNRLETRW
jgi:phosphate transport system permease protein